MWRRMNKVSDCAGSKTTLLPEEHGGMIINETGQQYIGSLKKNEKKKDTRNSKEIGKLFFNPRAWRKGKGILYSMLCVLLFFNFGFGQTTYTGVSSGPGQYAYHKMIVSSKLFTNDAVQCAQRKIPY